MHHKLEIALRALKNAREVRDRAVEAYGELESAHGSDSPEAKHYDRESVEPAHQSVGEAEASVIAAPSLSARDVLAKVTALLEDGDMPIGAMEALHKESAKFGEGDEHSSPKTARERVSFIAATLAVKAPEKLVAADGGPSQEVLAFCRETGSSLDYIFSGDVTSMIRQRHSAELRSQRHDTESRLLQVNALIRCAMVAEENETSGLDWKGVAEVLALAEEVLGEAIEEVEMAKPSRPTLVAAE